MVEAEPVPSYGDPTPEAPCANRGTLRQVAERYHWAVILFGGLDPVEAGLHPDLAPRAGHRLMWPRSWRDPSGYGCRVGCDCAGPNATTTIVSSRSNKSTHGNFMQ